MGVAGLTPYKYEYAHLLAGAKGTEVLRRLRHRIFKQLERDPPYFFPLGQSALRPCIVRDLDIEENAGVLRIGLPHLFLFMGGRRGGGGVISCWRSESWTILLLLLLLL